MKIEDELAAKQQALLKSYYDNWMGNSMPPTKTKKVRAPLRLKTASIAHDDARFSNDRMEEVLDMRMGWDIGEDGCPFNTCIARRINNEQAVVFLVTDKDAVMIKDDLNLFPSDALVTQLRLLSGGK